MIAADDAAAPSELLALPPAFAAASLPISVVMRSCSGASSFDSINLNSETK